MGDLDIGTILLLSVFILVWVALLIVGYLKKENTLGLIAGLMSIFVGSIFYLTRSYSLTLFTMAGFFFTLGGVFEAFGFGVALNAERKTQKAEREEHERTPSFDEQIARDSQE